MLKRRWPQNIRNEARFIFTVDVKKSLSYILQTLTSQKGTFRNVFEGFKLAWLSSPLKVCQILLQSSQKQWKMPMALAEERTLTLFLPFFSLSLSHLPSQNDWHKWRRNKLILGVPCCSKSASWQRDSRYIRVTVESFHLPWDINRNTSDWAKHLGSEGGVWTRDGHNSSTID